MKNGKINFKIGDTVKYSNPINKEEGNARFLVREITPANSGLKEKLTVEYITNKMHFKPVNTYFSSEFTNQF